MSMTDSTKPSLSKLPASHQNVVWNLTESTLTILSSLTEINRDIREALSDMSVIPGFIFGLLELSMAPDSVKQAAMLCLYALSSDWTLFTENLAEHLDWLQHLSALSARSDVTGIAACGILFEVNSIGVLIDPVIPSELSILKLLDAQLDRHCFRAASSAEALINHANAAEDERVLSLVLELIAAIAADTHMQASEGVILPPELPDDFEGFPDDDEMEEFLPEVVEGVGSRKSNDSDSDSSSNGMDEDTDQGPVTRTEPSSGDTTSSQPSSSLQGYDTPQGFLMNSTTPKILSLFKAFEHYPTNPDTPRTFRGAIPSKPFSSIRNLLLQTLTSISWTLTTAALLFTLRQQWQTQAEDIWKTIIFPVLISNTADIELASSITSLAWGVSRSVNGRIYLENDEHKKFMALYQASVSLPREPIYENDAKLHPDGPDASLGVKCIGVLGCLALCSDQISRNREIGVSLLAIVNNLPQTPPEDAIEALNQLFDVYADKEFDYDDSVFVQGGFLVYLRALQPKVQKMAKGVDKRKTPALRGRADEAVVNLKRFIKYKMEERRMDGSVNV